MNHESSPRGLVVLDLGSPASPSPKDVKIFLGRFLSDPRVVDRPPLGWGLLLRGLILPLRSRRVAKAYAGIFVDGESPLRRHTRNLAGNIRKILEQDSKSILVRHAFIIGEPSLEIVFNELKEKGCEKIRVIYLFPQRSGATTGSADDAVGEALRLSGMKRDRVECLRYFYRHPAYIECTAKNIDEHLKAHPAEKLLLSFHGYPLRRIFAGDTYYQDCLETARLLVERIREIPADHIQICFQSKFGREEWLEPSTSHCLKEFAGQGVSQVAVCCPSFLADNLETLYEIDIELKEEFLSAGGRELSLVPCLNAGDEWAKNFSATLARLPVEEQPELPQAPPLAVEPKQAYKVEPLSKEAKVSLKVVFQILLLDLIGFSIIFPLFPTMLEYYKEHEGEGELFGLAMSLVTQLREALGGSGSGVDVVLFGGVLGSLYSILQFVGAPFWGVLSDKFGRKPILLISSTGLVISYAIWMVADSFLILLVSRLLGGWMSANISTASAVVSDVTTRSNRSRGMAFIGIAFGLGFIIGPVLGALGMYLNLSGWLGGASGMHPFSGPACIALTMALGMLAMVVIKFKETLPPDRRGKNFHIRYINPVTLFRSEQYPGVTRNNLVYFLFLLSFSGMEFTLTFLTYERFSFSHMEQGMMFLYIGMCLVFVQGGYVRRAASRIGEKRMAGRGLIWLIPGLLLIGLAPDKLTLYVGLFCMATGSAQVIPCLTALASLYAPESEQGRMLGVFRSLGALARAFGPLFACFCFWKIGAGVFYALGAMFILLPLWLWRGLPDQDKGERSLLISQKKDL